VNKLLKMHRQMADVMKSMAKNKGLLSRLTGAMPMGGLPPGMKLPPGFPGGRK
jgi:signal recognition particle subunit SRP54